jgi:hypothetical protein
VLICKLNFTIHKEYIGKKHSTVHIEFSTTQFEASKGSWNVSRSCKEGLLHTYIHTYIHTYVCTHTHTHTFFLPSLLPSFFFSFFQNGVWNQGLALAWQARYYISHTPLCPFFALIIFQIGSWDFPWGWLRHVFSRPPAYLEPQAYGLRWCLDNILPGLNSNHNPSDLSLLSSWDYRCESLCLTSHTCILKNFGSKTWTNKLLFSLGKWKTTAKLRNSVDGWENKFE